MSVREVTSQTTLLPFVLTHCCFLKALVCPVGVWLKVLTKYRGCPRLSPRGGKGVSAAGGQAQRASSRRSSAPGFESLSHRLGRRPPQPARLIPGTARCLLSAGACGFHGAAPRAPPGPGRGLGDSPRRSVSDMMLSQLCFPDTLCLRPFSPPKKKNNNVLHPLSC